VNELEALFIFVLLLLLLFLRIPIYLSLYLGGLLGFIIFTDMDLTFVAQTFLLKLQNFSLTQVHAKKPKNWGNFGVVEFWV